jgi:hypothetical protein
MKTCETCKHWSPPLAKPTKKEPHPKGQCQCIQTYGNKLAEVEHDGCCATESPCYCSAPRLVTAALFGCMLWEKGGLR